MVGRKVNEIQELTQTFWIWMPGMSKECDSRCGKMILFWYEPNRTYNAPLLFASTINLSHVHKCWFTSIAAYGLSKGFQLSKQSTTQPTCSIHSPRAELLSRHKTRTKYLPKRRWDFLCITFSRSSYPTHNRFQLVLSNYLTQLFHSVQAGLLVANGVAVLHPQRFLSKCEWFVLSLRMKEICW